MKKGFPIILLVIIVCYSPCNGQNSSLEQVGTSMANFLKIGVGARALSMGDAYVALCDDITSMYWNPGALDRIEGSEFILQQTNWLVDTKIYYVGGCLKTQGWGSIGLSAHYFTSGEIEETTLLSPDGTGRTFTADDFAIGLTYSKRITDRFSTGISVKMIQESLYREKASTVALDVGSVFETDFLNNLRIGMCLSNLGGSMRLSGSDLSVQYAANPDFPTKVIRSDLATEEWDIPLYFRFGVAADVMNREHYRLTLSSEVMDSRDFIHRISVGAELGINDYIFLRSGYKFNYDEDSFSLGGGVKLNLAGTKMRLDYAYGKMDVFDNTQRFSFIFAM